MQTERTPDQQAAFDCGYQDEWSGAPADSAPARFLTGELFGHYSDGRNIALSHFINEQEAKSRAPEQAA